MDEPALRDLLIRWANINSGSGHVAGLERMRAALAAEFAKLRGAQVETVPLAGTAACALRVRQRPAAPRQVFLSGHYDTVYDAGHPFQTCQLLDARTLGGPGVADMKGGIVILLAALQAFERTAQASALGWEVLLTPDEETGSVASRPVIEEAAKRFPFALIFEPARENGDLVESRKGTGIFTVTCTGRAAHAGRAANEGRNAIVALAEFLVAAHAVPEDLPGVLLNVGSVQGGGAVNIVPDRASAEINIRITRANDAAAVLARLHELAAPINAREGYRLEIAGQFNRLPLEATPTSRALFAAWQQCARDVGAAPFSWTHVGGGSDGNLLGAAGLPCLDGLGVVGGHLHSASEYAHLPSLAERARIAARFLTKLSLDEVTLPVAAART
ncbi:hydrolase [Opitutus terrae]|uniref:Peptidase M20 n=1 Tax=Opitutus terrae (strain DSM 11246 / JCM 15787 / PB90-1) TaxID=452637 RepID=B1ZUT8_OPITP|nr:hydrolase [Opitutus terrae]ACB74972.1 peptidase M20 [Opitutus terrae PB90-1]